VVRGRHDPESGKPHSNDRVNAGVQLSLGPQHAGQGRHVDKEQAVLLAVRVAPRETGDKEMLAAAAHQLKGDRQAARFWHRQVRTRRPDADVRRFFEAFSYADIPERRLIEDALRKTGFSD
jgi:hypothetical protein